MRVPDIVYLPEIKKKTKKVRTGPVTSLVHYSGFSEIIKLTFCL